MKTTYTLLLFDLDGTLTDPMEGITRSVQYSLRHFGIEVTDLCSLTPFIGPPLAESFREFYGFDDGRIPEAIRLMREYFSERGWRENRLYDGMPQLLERLCASGLTLAVATSKPVVFARRILDHFDLARYFAFVGGAELDGSRQAKADVIAHVLQGLGGVDPATCLMIGDRRHDVAGAAAAVCGAVLPSFICILVIAIFFAQVRHNVVVDAAFKGMRPAVVALIVVPTIALARGMHPALIVVAVATALAVWWFGLSPIWLIAAGAAAGILWTVKLGKEVRR